MAQIIGIDIGDENIVLAKWKSPLNGNGIGNTEIVQNDYECRYHLMIGRVIRIKREPFEEFISKVEQI